MLDDVLALVSQTFEKNDYGVGVPTKNGRDVFVQVASITRQEFYEAGRNGLNPAFRFSMFAEDYQGETECVYRGKPYAIYRTYRVPDSDYIELYVQRKGGTNNVQ